MLVFIFPHLIMGITVACRVLIGDFGKSIVLALDWSIPCCGLGCALDSSSSRQKWHLLLLGRFLQNYFFFHFIFVPHTYSLTFRLCPFHFFLLLFVPHNTPFFYLIIVSQFLLFFLHLLLSFSIKYCPLQLLLFFLHLLLFLLFFYVPQNFLFLSFTSFLFLSLSTLFIFVIKKACILLKPQIN